MPDKVKKERVFTCDSCKGQPCALNVGVLADPYIPRKCPYNKKHFTEWKKSWSHTITIDGKDIEISEESYQELKKSLS